MEKGEGEVKNSVNTGVMYEILKNKNKKERNPPYMSMSESLTLQSCFEMAVL